MVEVLTSIQEGSSPFANCVEEGGMMEGRDGKGVEKKRRLDDDRGHLQ